MNRYGLSFISDENLRMHTLETVSKFSTGMSLREFQRNVVDPVKLTFSVHVYRRNIDDVINAEILRQLEKTNENLIGYFHQNIFRHVGGGWSVPKDGWDVENPGRRIFAELKNKHNTMNASSEKAIHARMRGLAEGDNNATCYLVEVIAKKSQDIPWRLGAAPLRPDRQARVRRISIDRFYEVVTGQPNAFRDLCQVLGRVIDDIVATRPGAVRDNTVLQELHAQGGGRDTLRQLFLNSFGTYQGFDDFQIRQ